MVGCFASHEPNFFGANSGAWCVRNGIDEERSAPEGNLNTIPLQITSNPQERCLRRAALKLCGDELPSPTVRPCPILIVHGVKMPRQAQQNQRRCSPTIFFYITQCKSIPITVIWVVKVTCYSRIEACNLFTNLSYNAGCNICKLSALCVLVMSAWMPLSCCGARDSFTSYSLTGQPSEQQLCEHCLAAAAQAYQQSPQWQLHKIWQHRD